MEKTKKLRNRLIDPWKIGRYIKKLRNKAGLTRRQLAAEISGIYDEKSIDDWENRGVMPNQESLISLADYFKITIDDLLEGGNKTTNEEFLDCYPIFKPFDYETFERDRNVDVYTNHQKQLILINTRFKELVIKFNSDSLTRNEDAELRFLFTNMYCLNGYVKKINIKLTNDAYLDFITLLCYLKEQKLNKYSFYWEVQKYIEERNQYALYVNLESCISAQKGFEHEKFCLLESWVKDMYLARFQKFDILHYNPEDNVYWLKRFEEKNGKEYDKEEYTKELLKYLIDNGAVINPWFLSIIRRKKVQKNIIDRLEELYNKCVRPITIYYSNSQSSKHEQIKATIVNNRWNRFLRGYYGFYCIFNNKNLSPKKIYNLVMGDEADVIYQLANSFNVQDIANMKYSHLKARFNPDLNTWNKHKNEFLENERLIEKGLKEIPILEEKLKKGEITYFDFEEEEIGPTKYDDVCDYVCYWKYDLTYNEFLRRRNHKATKQLREEIDKLSLEEIRHKYFPVEVIEDE